MPCMPIFPGSPDFVPPDRDLLKAVEVQYWVSCQTFTLHVMVVFDPSSSRMEICLREYRLRLPLH